MITNALKQSLSIVFVLAFLAGCSSTATDSSSTGNDGDVVTGSSGDNSLGATDGSADSLETVVYFDFDQAVLLPETRSLLLAHAENLRGSDSSVRLEGHADERGSREYNMALGERRANAVRDFLVLQGVGRGSLEVISYGEESPLASGNSESSWSQNRRVEIQY